LRQRELFAMNALEEVLLWCGTQNPSTEQGRIDPRVRDCLDALCRDLAARLTLDTLAARAGLSVSRLAHLFREQVGMTPQQFQERQRLERARQMLELSGRGIGDIAADVGYENPFYFTLRFKKWTGLSPRDYRRRLGLNSPPPPG
jgi:AraC family transcriptional regulator of arabinose operon